MSIKTEKNTTATKNLYRYAFPLKEMMASEPLIGWDISSIWEPRHTKQPKIDQIPAEWLPIGTRKKKMGISPDN